MMYDRGRMLIMVILEFFKPFLDVLFAILKSLFCMPITLTDWLGINTGDMDICNNGGGGEGAGVGKAFEGAGNLVINL